jgi:hypothetical protein
LTLSGFLKREALTTNYGYLQKAKGIQQHHVTISNTPYHEGNKNFSITYDNTQNWLNQHQQDGHDALCSYLLFSSKWNQNSRGMDQTQSDEPTAASAPSLGSLWW